LLVPEENLAIISMIAIEGGPGALEEIGLKKRVFGKIVKRVPPKKKSLPF